uniref:C2H2-type domain-containing protein n=1 Tax=Ditylenchus dipsaci TaxID=166011 RepID=A0A915ERU6_9BILA
MDHYGPIEFRFDSSQRKNQVIIYDSVRYPGKSSEWYFVRKNQSTLNETYRCVHCRGAHEKAPDVPANRGCPGARITVRQEHFMTDPDVPLGVHICDFKNNDNCSTYIVWGRRALLRANSELRFNPEKPKLKFQKLLKSIEDGEDEYAHLSVQIRQMVISYLGSNKGFDSRRRSFARNNSLAVKRMLDDPQSMDDFQKESIHKFENTKRKRLNNAGRKKCSTSRTNSYLCGLPSCKARFANRDLRAEHRYVEHPEAIFVENKRQLLDYRRMGTNSMQEVIIHGNGDVVVDDSYEELDDEEEDLEPMEDVEVDHGADDLHHRDEGVVEYVVYGEHQEETGQQHHNAIAGHDYVEQEAQQFVDDINNMLFQIRGYAEQVAHDPMRRDLLYARVQNLLDEAGCSDQYIEVAPMYMKQMTTRLTTTYKRCKISVALDPR